jgi:hypothetical protein
MLEPDIAREQVMRTSQVRPLPVAIVLAFALGSAMHAQAPAGAGDRWKPLSFLMGKWEGSAKGQPGSGTSVRHYGGALGDQFIEVHNRSTYPPQDRNPRGETHEDAAYISFDKGRGAYVLRQFHTEGFVNTYVGTIAGAGHVVFTSEAIENIPAGWRARETYRSISADEFIETFELAEPGKDFEVYSETRFTRAK